MLNFMLRSYLKDCATEEISSQVRDADGKQLSQNANTTERCAEFYDSLAPKNLGEHEDRAHSPRSLKRSGRTR